MTYSSEVLADSPAAYYRLGEASGTTMVDSSGNARDGAYSGTYTLGATGLLYSDASTAVDFAPTTARGITAYGSWMNAVATFTIEAVIKPDTTTGNKVIAARTAVGGNSWQLRLDGTSLVLWTYPGTWVSLVKTNAVVAGTTYHVAATWDGTTRRLYLNGVEVASAAGNAPGGANVGLSVGNLYDQDTEPFDGVIDEVAYYPAALSATRIGVHFGASVPPASVRLGGLQVEGLRQLAQPSVRLGGLQVEALRIGPIPSARLGGLQVEVLRLRPTGPTVDWWDGAALLDAEVMGWWTSAAFGNVETLGWWDGDSIEPLG